MAKPTPFLRGEHWRLDLRWAGLGQYKLITPGLAELAIDATQEAYEIFHRERGAAELKAAQGSIFAGPSMRKAVHDYLDDREHDTVDGRKYVQCYARGLERELGNRPVRQFYSDQGAQILRDWRDDLAKRGLRPKTRRNYINACFQVLGYAVERGFLTALPKKPKATVIGETLESPDASPYTEADFRVLREGIYVGSEQQLMATLKSAAAVDDCIARRRLYCSFGFYTGMHVADLDKLLPHTISPDFGSYWRTNQKSARTVKGAGFDLPEQLWLDVQGELRRLGRPWREGELICGGRWANGSRVLKATAERLNLPTPVNFRSVMRRSTVYEYTLRGWSVEEIARILGHVDDRMVLTVYGRVPPRLRSPVKIPWDRESSARLLGGVPWTSRAKVVPFRSVPLAPELQRDKA